MPITVNFTTEPSSTSTDERISIYIDTDRAEDNTKVKQIRIFVQGNINGDDGSITPKQLWYRAANAPLAHDGVADGSTKSKPLPISTGTASDLNALIQFITLMRKQWRLDVNNDVE